jgi:hypothetical protein
MEIVAAPERFEPFPADGLVIEEDTFCVLGGDRSVRDPGEPLMTIKTRLLEIKPQPTGSIIVRGGRPLRFLAIVHDLNQDPSWKEEWVSEAMGTALQEADRQHLRSLAVPFLGAVHGRLEKRRVLELLRSALDRFSPQSLERLWLIVPVGMDPGLLDILETRQKA